MATHAPHWPAEPFSIGLKPVDPTGFLIVDDRLPDYVSQKIELYRTHFDDVVMAEAGTEQAQKEAAELLLDDLRRNHADRFQWSGNTVLPKGISPDALGGLSYPPLAAIALAVQDDLVLMRRDESGWRLVAASLCFPSSWSLADKFGQPMRQIHGPVPLSVRMATLIERIFDNLQATTPVWRGNWSLEADGNLRQERHESHRDNNRKDLSGDIWLRTEYQTLHKLPLSGDILFTIRIATTDISSEAKTGAGQEALSALARQFGTMKDAQKDYKGVAQDENLLMSKLANLVDRT